MEKLTAYLRNGKALPVIYFAAFCAMMALLTRLRLAELLVDYGRELYVPWRLTEGDVLYRDIAYFNGLLAPYFNALLFKVFGVSMHTIMAYNMTLIFGICLMIYRYFAIAFDQKAGMVAGTVFVSMFAFSHLSSNSGYNYVAPYSHDLTYGLTLCLVTLLLLQKNILHASSSNAIWIGLLTGAVFLTKPEVFVALAGTIGLYFILVKSKKDQLRKMAVPMVFGFLFSVAIGWLFLASQADIKTASMGIVAPWSAIVRSDVTTQFFYRHWMGLENPVFNLAMSVAGFLFLGAVFSFLSSLSVLLHGIRPLRIFLMSLFFWVAVLTFSSVVPHALFARSLAMLTLLILCVSAWHYRGHSNQDKEKALSLILLSAFALMMLLKIFLHPRIGMYGFVLAMPATVLFLTWFIFGIDRRMFCTVAVRHAYESLAAGAVCGLCLMTACFSVIVCLSKYKVMTAGNEVFYSITFSVPAGDLFEETYGYLNKKLSDGDRVAVLPEGIMLNYLLRTESGIPHTSFMGAEKSIFGEESLLRSLQKAMPEFIVIFSRDMNEYGLPRFGTHDVFGLRTRQWLEQNYSVDWQYGENPYETFQGGVLVYEKNTGHTP